MLFQIDLVQTVVPIKGFKCCREEISFSMTFSSIDFYFLANTFWCRYFLLYLLHHNTFCCLIYILRSSGKQERKGLVFSIANGSLHGCLFSVLKSIIFFYSMTGTNMICLHQTCYPICAPRTRKNRE